MKRKEKYNLLKEFQKYYNKDVEYITPVDINDSHIEKFLFLQSKTNNKLKGVPLKIKVDALPPEAFKNIGSTILLMQNKDGSTNIWSEGVCLGTNLDTEGINKAYDKLTKQ